MSMMQYLKKMYRTEFIENTYIVIDGLKDLLRGNKSIVFTKDCPFKSVSNLFVSNLTYPEDFNNPTDEELKIRIEFWKLLLKYIFTMPEINIIPNLYQVVKHVDKVIFLKNFTSQ